MKPIQQTKVQSAQVGNCLAASLASLLELPIEEVPPFEDAMPSMALWAMVQDWLTTRGLFLVQTLNAPSGYALAMGPTNRQQMGQVEWHCCIAYDGKIVFDPHPSQEGLSTAVFYACVTRLPQVQRLE